MEVMKTGQGRPMQTENLSLEGQKDISIGLDRKLMEANYNEKTALNEDDLKKAVEKLNSFLEDNNTYAEYETHEKFSNSIMIRIRDSKTKEVIKEVPPKKILDMVAQMCEMVGILIDKKA
jgi:flagellar protein FlaG